MQNINKNINSILPYSSKFNSYFINLNNILNKIRTLDKINLEIQDKIWDSNIKYRLSWDKNLSSLDSKFYLEKGQWIDFIFLSGFINNKFEKKIINPFTIEELISSKLRLALLIFWRDIINNFDSNTSFKLQLKLNINFPIDNYEEVDYTDLIKESYQIRSIGSIRIYNKNNFYEALSYIIASLYLSLDNYTKFNVENIIITYNICVENSVLNKIKLSNLRFNSLNDKHKNNIKNKNTKNINDRNLPLTTDLTKWGSINKIKGSYPYKFNSKETRLLINSDGKAFSNIYNYIVSIKGFEINGKKIILHRVSVTDINFKLIYLNFIDIIYDSNLPNSFVRLINDSQYVYDKGIKVFAQKRKKVKYFTPLTYNKKVSKNFITMDLETKNINGSLIPYCVSIFDGNKAHSFYILDYNSHEDMLKASILFLLKRKFNKNKIYLHNFSYFDGIYLMKIISELVDPNNIKPVIRDGRIINLRVEFEPESKKIINKNPTKNKYYVEFRDSYLLLTTSLEKLGKTFAVNDGILENKLPFPYRFVNEKNVDYNYNGPFPEFKYFDKISEQEYNNIIFKLEGKDKTNWDLRKETIRYCEQDCKTLYYAIKEFGKLIYLQFQVDISKTPTISSLAFRIYRVKYLNKDNKIAILSGFIYDFIYQGYYGGHVDSYIPKGQNIKGYDVNSLYPTNMFNNPMPVGNPYYFEGDINYFNLINFNYPSDLELNGDLFFSLKHKGRATKMRPKTIYSYLNEIFNLYNSSEFETKIIKFLNLNGNSGVLCNKKNLPYGFFEVNLKTPALSEWNEPILLKKHKTMNGWLRTIAPVGQWNGIYFSEELYNAIDKNPDHEFKTKRGFLFRQEILFKDYVETLFNLRINSPKNSPLNIIAKLLLNSLYGRFGMNPDKANHIILTDMVDKDKLFINNEITNIVDLGNGNELVSFLNKKDTIIENSDLKDYEDKDSSLLINVSIAATITGYSRVFMSYFKNNPLFKLYYSDTDSVFLDINLNSINPDLIGSELGQLKLEYEFKEAVFLAPKVYGGKNTEGKSIVKAKGVKNIIPYEDLKTLLNKNTKLKIPNEKWYRNLSEGNIQVKQEIYNLTINSSKRELIYDSNGNLIDTKPLIIHESED